MSAIREISRIGQIARSVECALTGPSGVFMLVVANRVKFSFDQYIPQKHVGTLLEAKNRLQRSQLKPR